MSQRINFRAKMKHNTIDTISLHTIDGTVGYRIVKFELFSASPSTERTESTIKIFKVNPGVANGAVDFSDNTLIAAGFLGNYEEAQYPPGTSVIFDSEIFNQDIFVTHDSGNASSVDCNYYIELEQIKLNSNETAVATLKNIKNR